VADHHGHPDPAQLAAAAAALQGLLEQLHSLLKPVTEWLTVDEVAGELKCSRDTVTRLVDAGRLPAKNVGHGKHAAYRVRRGDLASLDVPAPAKPRQSVRRRRAVAAYPRLA
jgi:excisionase family DNA binding protein